MPWTPQSFAARHNHHLPPPQAAHAAYIANAILRRGAPEGVAIATANKMVQRRDLGGGVDPTQGGVGGPTPTSQTMSPVGQSLVQRYASLPTEKLQELAGRLGGTQQGQIVRQILQKKLMQPNAAPLQPSGQPQSGGQQPNPMQAGQQGLQMMGPPQMARRGGMIHRAFGGDMGVSPSQADPWWTRQEARQADTSNMGGGFLAGTTGGRADSIKTAAPGGAYVLPADVIAGLGDGNSLAGARVMDEILRSGPHGTPQVRQGRGMGPPRPPSMRGEGSFYRAGGIKSSPEAPTPVKLSHGEYLVAPHHVLAIGGGDMEKGHRVLDHFVMAVRQRYAKRLQSLPPPVGSKLKRAA